MNDLEVNSTESELSWLQQAHVNHPSDFINIQYDTLELQLETQTNK